MVKRPHSPSIKKRPLQMAGVLALVALSMGNLAFASWAFGPLGFESTLDAKAGAVNDLTPNFLKANGTGTLMNLTPYGILEDEEFKTSGDVQMEFKYLLYGAKAESYGLLENGAIRFKATLTQKAGLSTYDFLAKYGQISTPAYIKRGTSQTPFSGYSYEKDEAKGISALTAQEATLSGLSGTSDYSMSVVFTLYLESADSAAYTKIYEAAKAGDFSFSISLEVLP